MLCCALQAATCNSCLSCKGPERKYHLLSKCTQASAVASLVARPVTTLQNHIIRGMQEMACTDCILREVPRMPNAYDAPAIAGAALQARPAHPPHTM